jgi:hypothetical protein
MPIAMTFTSLQADVRSYCERGGSTTDAQFNTQLPGFINLRERQIARELKIQGFINNVTSAMTTSLGVYPKPTRWRETVSINVGTNIGTATTYNTRVIVFPRSYEYCRTYWPDDTQTGTPEFYADYDYNHYVFVPTPSEAFPYEVNYWQLLQLLDDTNQTNWLTEYSPNALLHGTLVEAFNYLKNPEQAALWQQAYDRDMSGLSGEDLQKILDRAQKRTTS